MGIRGLIEFARQYTKYYTVSKAHCHLPSDRRLVTIDGSHLVNSSLFKEKSYPNDQKNLNLREILGKLLVLRRIFPGVLVVFDGQNSHPIKERYSRIKAFYGLTLEQKNYYVEKFVQQHPDCEKTNVICDYLDELAHLHDQERSRVKRLNYKIMNFITTVFRKLGIAYYIADSEADFVMAKLNSISIISSGDSDMIYLCDYVIIKIIPPTKNKIICLTKDYDKEGGIVFLDTQQMLDNMIKHRFCTKEQYEHACFLSNTEVNLTWTCKCHRKACSCRPDFNNMLQLLKHQSIHQILTSRCQIPRGFTPESVEKDIKTYYDIQNHTETIQYIKLEPLKYDIHILSSLFTPTEQEYLTQHALYWFITKDEANDVYNELSTSHESQYDIFNLI